jgi:hypothetical protein
MSALGQKQTFALHRPCPLYPQERTFAVHKRMSAWANSGHQRLPAASGVLIQDRLELSLRSSGPDWATARAVLGPPPTIGRSIHCPVLQPALSTAGQTIVAGIPRHRISLRLSHIAVRILSVSILGRPASLRPSGGQTFFVETSVLGVPRHRISLRLCHVAIRTSGRRLAG